VNSSETASTENGHRWKLSPKVLIQDATGRYLLLKRSNNSIEGPGMWDLPGGKSHAGEDLESAVGREVFEETGLKISIDKVLGAFKADIMGLNVAVLVLQGRLLHGTVRLSSEHDDYRWVQHSELMEVDPAVLFLHKFRELLSS
jgi:8-oxo-dGTP diphosphatase